MSDVPYKGWDMTATGGLVPRKMPDRLADTVNVMDFGATGLGVANDTVAIQRALNAAFTNASQASNYDTAPGGGAPVPNGVTNARLNRVVYIPNGHYLCTGLVLPPVYGGTIFGAGGGTTWLHSIFSSTPCIATNGCTNFVFENLRISGTGRSDSNNFTCLDLNWDNVGPVGLDNVTLLNCAVGDCHYGLKVAENGFGGTGITLVHFQSGQCGTCVRINSDDAAVTTIGGGLSENFIGVHVLKGSYSATGSMCAGLYRPADPSYPGQTDVRHESTGTSTFTGTRTESQNCLYITQGRANLMGVSHNVGTNAPSQAVTIDGTGGEVSLEHCSCGNVTDANSGLIKGSGYRLWMRNVELLAEAVTNPFASFTGKIMSWERALPLNVAALPTTNAGEGLMVNVGDLSAAKVSAGWGATVTPGSDGGGSGHALLRFNNSVWTIVGL